VERVVKGGRERAAVGTDSPQGRNAASVLSAWNDLERPVHRFFVNSVGHAWYESEGGRRFLADVPDGFEWPE
jgi:hypothetical protein